MSTPPERRPPGVRAVALLAVLAGGVAALLALVQELTRERIAANEAARVLARLEALLPPGYDNAPQLDRTWVQAPELGSPAPLPVYRARAGGAPLGAVLTVVAPDGYVGQIRLLVGFDAAGRVTGVRAVAHQETPGLGDGIEIARSDWIFQFDGLDPAAMPLALRRDGGGLDALTGATVTSRAVIGAVERAVLYFAARRPELFTAAPDRDTAEP